MVTELSQEHNFNWWVFPYQVPFHRTRILSSSSQSSPLILYQSRVLPSADAIELKLEVTMSLVASVPDELVDRGSTEAVVLVHSDSVLVVVLIDSTEDSRYDSLGGPLLLYTSWWSWLLPSIFLLPAAVLRPFWFGVVVVAPKGFTAVVGVVVALLLEA